MDVGGGAGVGSCRVVVRAAGGKEAIIYIDFRKVQSKNARSAMVFLVLGTSQYCVARR